jgi:hypothetical protein
MVKHNNHKDNYRDNTEDLLKAIKQQTTNGKYTDLITKITSGILAEIHMFIETRFFPECIVSTVLFNSVYTCAQIQHI